MALRRDILSHWFPGIPSAFLAVAMIATSFPIQVLAAGEQSASAGGSTLAALPPSSAAAATELSDTLTGTVVDDNAPSQTTPEAPKPASPVLSGGVSMSKLASNIEHDSDMIVGSVVETKNPYNRFPPAAVVTGVVYDPEAQQAAGAAATALIFTGLMGAGAIMNSTTRTGGGSCGGRPPTTYIPTRKKCGTRCP
jgi:hypothetical protein